MRILCVLLPHFPWRCEVRRHPDAAGRPAMVVQSKNIASSQKLVLDHSPGLEDLLCGMPLQQALARHGEAELLVADVPYYQSVFNEILDGLEQKSPLVEGAELGCAFIGVDGLQSLYPEDGALTKAMQEAVEDFSPLMGIAENKFLAYLAARHCPSNGYKILSGHIDTFLKELPCDVLPASIKTLDRLRDFGLATLGQVANLPLGPCQSQFGVEGKRIWELAHGIDDTPLYPRFMEEIIDDSVMLSSVTVSLNAILVAIESLLARIFVRNTLKGRGIRRLTVWTRSWNAERWERNINFKEPTMNVKNTIARIKHVLEEYPQPSPVEQVGIKISGLSYPRGRQKSLFSDVRAQEQLAEDIQQLEIRLGNPQVYKVKEVEPWSRIPERRYALTRANR